MPATGFGAGIFIGRYAVRGKSFNGPYKTDPIL